MAFNPTAVNVSNRSSIDNGLEQGVSTGFPKNFFGSAFKRDPSSELGPNADALYKIQVAGYEPKLGGRYGRGYEGNKSSNFIYGNYWEAPVTVFSIAPFEAQLLMQSGEEGRITRRTSRQGNEAYNLTKNLLEAIYVENTDEENLIEDDRSRKSINIIA